MTKNKIKFPFTIHVDFQQNSIYLTNLDPSKKKLNNQTEANVGLGGLKVVVIVKNRLEILHSCLALLLVLLSM